MPTDSTAVDQAGSDAAVETVLVAWTDAADSNMDSFGTARLVSTEGCLLLEGLEDPVRNAIVWPLGTRWSSPERQVVLADGGRVNVGDIIGFGGGFVSVDQVDAEFRQPGWLSTGVDVLERCAATSGQSDVFLADVDGEINVVEDASEPLSTDR